MPSKPRKSKMLKETPEILNAIRADASVAYQDAVPIADPSDPASLRGIGNVLMEFTAYKNEFLDALINRIAFSMIKNQLYYNPWSFFKKGLIENGETIEEIFTNICQPFNFDQQTAEAELYKRVIPDVRAAFHTMNYQMFYKQTISDKQLKQAFLSWSGVSDMIASIVNAIYTSANNDEFIVMKYMIQRAYLNGNIKTVTIPALTSENVSKAVTQVKALSNALTFMSDKYNAAGVTTFTPQSSQIVLLGTLADAIIDVDLLAGAFNLPYANLIQQRILVDDFANVDAERLQQLLGSDPNYVPFTEDEIAQLKQIQMCVLDKDWFMIYDNLQEFTEAYNAQGLYWNYFFHQWKTFSYSPFSNAIMLISPTGEGGVTGLTITPDTDEVARGDSANFQVTATPNNQPVNVAWSLSETVPQPGISTMAPLLSTVDQNGIVTIAENEPNDVLYVVATYVDDPSIMAYATINIKNKPVITGITITPKTAVLQPGQTKSFTVSVTGNDTASLGYTLSVSGNKSNSTVMNGNNLSIGTNETATTLIVTATSTQDQSFTATATVTVEYPQITQILINGKSQYEVTADPGDSLDLTPTVTGIGDYDPTLQWSVYGNTATGTTITGNNTAATLTINSAEASNSLTVVCASQAYPGVSATAIITLNQPVKLRINDKEVDSFQLIQGDVEQYTFPMTLNKPVEDYNFTVAIPGTTQPLDVLKVDTDPLQLVIQAKADATPGTYQASVVCTNADDASLKTFARLNITIKEPPAVVINEQNAEVNVGDTLQMTETHKGLGDSPTITWSITSGAGFATISSTGLLTATGEGEVTVKVVATDGTNTVEDTASVMVKQQDEPNQFGVVFTPWKGSQQVTNQYALVVPLYNNNHLKYKPTPIDFTIGDITISATSKPITINGLLTYGYLIDLNSGGYGISWGELATLVTTATVTYKGKSFVCNLNNVYTGFKGDYIDYTVSGDTKTVTFKPNSTMVLEDVEVYELIGFSLDGNLTPVFKQLSNIPKEVTYQTTSQNVTIIDYVCLRNGSASYRGRVGAILA